MSTSFIEEELLLPRQPFPRNVSLLHRWRGFPITYRTSIALAVTLGVTFAEFGDDVAELSVDAIDEFAGFAGGYAGKFGLGLMPMPINDDGSGSYDSVHYTEAPEASAGELVSNWVFWLQNPDRLATNDPINFFGLARVACRMFQLQVARELLIVFGLVNTPKGGE